MRNVLLGLAIIVIAIVGFVANAVKNDNARSDAWECEMYRQNLSQPASASLATFQKLDPGHFLTYGALKDDALAYMKTADAANSFKVWRMAFDLHAMYMHCPSLRKQRPDMANMMSFPTW